MATKLEEQTRVYCHRHALFLTKNAGYFSKALIFQEDVQVGERRQHPLLAEDAGLPAASAKARPQLGIQFGCFLSLSLERNNY